MDLKIECPKCGAKIDLTKKMGDLVDERAKQEASQMIEEERKKSAVRTAEQVRKAAEEADRKAREDEHRKSEKAKVKLEKDNRKLQAQVAAKDKKLERQRKENEKRVEALAEKRTKQEVQKARSEIEKSYAEKLGKKDLVVTEYHKKLQDAQARAQELEAKLSQGSAQAQGVIAEDDLFQFLRKHMPADRCQVEKWGQGKKGTDVIVHVHTNGGRVGAIIVDDKWANKWRRDWPEKVWADMQRHEADFAYIAANPSAFPEEIRAAGFGVAPCRRSGVRVWVVDRSNLPLIMAILTDSVEKVLKLAEVKTIHGAGSEAVKRFQAYLSRGYEIDLREKAKYMSMAVKALNEVRKKVNNEYERAFEALKSYWTTEERVHRDIMGCLGEGTARSLPHIEFIKER